MRAPLCPYIAGTTRIRPFIIASKQQQQQQRPPYTAGVFRTLHFPALVQIAIFEETLDSETRAHHPLVCCTRLNVLHSRPFGFLTPIWQCNPFVLINARVNGAPFCAGVYFVRVRGCGARGVILIAIVCLIDVCIESYAQRSSKTYIHIRDMLSDGDRSKCPFRSITHSNNDRL